jgi:hypothetical protein
MVTSIDSIQEKLFARSPPQLEPGTKVWDKELTKEIKGLKVHRFVIACELGFPFRTKTIAEDSAPSRE